MADNYQVLTNRNFSGGLNLRDKADVVKQSEAIDLLNVDFTDIGAVRQRDGYLEFTSSELTNRVDSMSPYYTSGGTRQLLVGCGTRLEALNTSGGVVASATGLTGGPYTFARFAAPGSELAFAANGSDTLRQWNGSAWSAPTGTVNGSASSSLPKGAAVCVTPNTNRLVVTAYGTGTTSGPAGAASSSNPSRVHFSNIQDPFTWELDGSSGRGRNYVDLTPGDGEQVMAAVTFRDKVIVFKESKYFVFEGEGTNADFTPLFRYRAVDTGVGLAAKQAVAVAREGVYFMDHTGLYYTNGGDPLYLSDKISPLWTGNPEFYFLSDTINFAQVALTRITWHDERIYVAVPTGSATANDRIIVLDPQQGWWSLYDVAASALASWTRSDQQELHFGYASGTKDTGRFSITVNTDGGATIASRWRSGWTDDGASIMKRIREMKLWGSGAITLKLYKDFEPAPSSQSTVTFASPDATWPGSGTWEEFIESLGGIWPGGGQITAQLNRDAIRGTDFSYEFTSNAADETWAIHRISRHLADQRIPSVVGEA